MRETNWWNHTLRLRQQMEVGHSEAYQEAEDLLLSCHQATGGDLKDRKGVETAPESSRSLPGLPHFPSCPYTTGSATGGPGYGASR